MPRFYFDIQDGTGDHRDDVGDDFDSFPQAREQAQALLPHIAREQFHGGGDQMISCAVRDADGTTLYRGELTYRGIDLEAEPAVRREAARRSVLLGPGLDRWL